MGRFYLLSFVAEAVEVQLFVKKTLPQVSNYGFFRPRRKTSPHKRPVRLAVRTPPFHGGNTGSSPVRVAIMLAFSEASFFLPAFLRFSKEENT